MARVAWVGKAQAVKKVMTFTPTAANNAVYKITIGTKTVSFTADASATVAEITAGLVAAMVNTTDPPPAEFLEATWTDGTTLVTMTANTAGMDMTVTSSTTGGGSLTAATTTAATGPSDVSNVNNWSTGALPSAADDVVYSLTNVPMLYNLTALSGIALTSFVVESTLSGASIGLPFTNANGYIEYRTRALTINTTTLRVKDNNASLIKLLVDRTAGTTDVQIDQAGSGVSDDAAVQLQGPDIGAVELNGGTCDICRYGDETGTVAGAVKNSGGTLRLGRAISTLASIAMSDGTLETFATLSGNLDLTGGTLTLGGTAAVSGTTTIYGGTLDHRTSGTLTAVVLGSADGGTLDMRNDLSACTFSAFTLNAGGQYLTNRLRAVTITGNAVITSVANLLAA